MRREFFIVSDGFKDPLSGRRVTVLTSVRDANGNHSGFVSISLDLLRLNERLFQATPKNVIVALSDPENQILLHSITPEAWIGKSLPEHQRQMFKAHTLNALEPLPLFERGQSAVTFTP